MLKFGVSMFFTDYSIAPGELGQALEAARVRIGLGARALAHSGQPQDAISRRRRSAEEIL